MITHKTLTILLLALPMAAFAEEMNGVHVATSPGIVEHIDGSELSRVILTQEAVDRLALVTAPVGAHTSERLNRQIAELNWVDDAVFIRLEGAGTLPPTVYIGGTDELVLVNLEPGPEQDLFAFDAMHLRDATRETHAQVFVAAPPNEVPLVAVPDRARLYDAHGRSWVYLEIAPLTYLRKGIEVAYRDGELLVLKSGPAVGDTVVVTGVMELFGTEFEIGH